MSLYSFVRGFNFTQAPGRVQALMRTCLVDIIGVAAGASPGHTASVLRAYALDHYPAARLASRLWFDGRPVHPLGAAYAGGFCVDSLDAHEGHFTSKGHAGATVVPAVVALVDAYRAQGRGLSGEELLTLITLGYETALRAGQALMATAPEYHASGAFSGIGVVCAGARLLNLDEQTFNHALGIAEYFGPRCPMMRLIDHPSMLRDAHGAGAYAGLNALLMAQAGVTGAPAATVENTEVAPFWASLGQAWEVEEQYFKPWPVCRWAQPALTAMTGLMAQAPDLAPGAIEAITVETFGESVRLQGHYPRNADEAQYALAYPLAALVARGQVGAEEVTGTAIHSPDILQLSGKITLQEAPDLSARFPGEILSRVRVHLKDGRVLASPTTPAKGDPALPLSEEDFARKFRLLAEPSLGPERCHALQVGVATLAGESHCERFLADLVAPRQVGL